MLTRIWPILVLAFSVLLGLGLVLGLIFIRQANEAYAETLSIHQSFQATEDALHNVRKEIFLSSILLRDFFLDSSIERNFEHKRQLEETRVRIFRQLEDLAGSVPPAGSPLDRLRSRINAYWDSIDPIFAWDSVEKRAQASRFLREEVLSRRDDVLNIAEQIQSLNKGNFRRELERISARHEEFERYETKVLVLGFGMGLLVSAVSSVLILRTHRQVKAHQRQTERAERELRKLSQRLVHAQEEERRRISRELHDQVGQMLTGLRMELRNLERCRDAPKEEFDACAEDTKRVIDETLQCVRDLAMGLRPSMLDDLGLAPALEWQVRDFTRRSGIPVSLKMDEETLDLSDEQNTCVYRVVQEALTNCARHASASKVAVHVIRNARLLDVVIGDDGKGFERSNGRGLGLLGMEERARELGGSMSIMSQPGRGTIVSLQIPLEKPG
ncbi:MAG: sensor histidine kinase [Acidobacteria bacterium]|nr:MAG: sensor histidine kinase [Acidobacteriota bacterium]